MSAKITCNFSPKPIPVTILNFSEPASPVYRNLITKMFAFCGQRDLSLFIYNTTSADLDYACCGYNNDGKPSIVINEERLNALPNIARLSIVAHEIGHFNNRNIDESILTMKMELNADYHNGFWCSRNGIDDINSICLPYTLVGEDSIHPNRDIRIDSVLSGYRDGKKRFDESSLISTVPDNFKRGDIDLVLTINPKVKVENGIRKFDVYLNTVVTKSAEFSESIIFSKISFVRYIVDTTFKRELLKSSSKETNFEFLLTRVWGDFPVTAIIRFTDYSEISITKTFQLPN